MNTLMEDYKADSSIIEGAENSMSHLSNVLNQQAHDNKSSDPVKFKLDDDLEDLLKSEEIDLVKMVEETLPELSKLESEEDPEMLARKIATDQEVKQLLGDAG